MIDEKNYPRWIDIEIILIQILILRVIVRITTNIYLIKHSKSRGVISSENKRDEKEFGRGNPTGIIFLEQFHRQPFHPISRHGKVFLVTPTVNFSELMKHRRPLRFLRHVVPILSLQRVTISLEFIIQHSNKNFYPIKLSHMYLNSLNFNKHLLF